MKRTTSFRFGNGIRRPLESFRPNLETLEERLPPGDAVPSGVLAQAVAGAGHYSPATSAAAVALTTGLRPGHGMDYQVSAAPVPAGAGTFRPTFAAADFSSQDAHRTESAVGAGKDQARPAPHRPLELDPNLLDSLLEDNWDESAAPKPRHRFQPTSPDRAPQPTTFLEGGMSAGPGSKDRPAPAPQVQPTTPTHGDIIPFSPQGQVPPDHGRVPLPPGSGGGVPPQTPPEDDDCACNSSGQLNGNASGSTGGYDTGREFSEGPVRYFDGTVKYTATDLESSGFGESWGVTRTWTNGGWAAALPGTTNGSGIAVSQQPFLEGVLGSFLIVVDNTWDPHYFMGNDNTGYVADFFSEESESLSYRPSTHDYLFRDSRGDQMTFFDFSTNWPRPCLANQKMPGNREATPAKTTGISDSPDTT